MQLSLPLPPSWHGRGGGEKKGAFLFLNYTSPIQGQTRRGEEGREGDPNLGISRGLFPPTTQLGGGGRGHRSLPHLPPRPVIHGGKRKKGGEKKEKGGEGG